MRSPEPMTPPMIEAEVRKLRDQIYGKSSEHNWQECKHNWMREDSIAWLIQECARGNKR